MSHPGILDRQDYCLRSIHCNGDSVRSRYSHLRMKCNNKRRVLRDDTEFLRWFRDDDAKLQKFMVELVFCLRGEVLLMRHFMRAILGDGEAFCIYFEVAVMWCCRYTRTSWTRQVTVQWCVRFITHFSLIFLCSPVLNPRPLITLVVWGLAGKAHFRSNTL